MPDLDKILKAFKNANLKLNPATCVFATQKCEYLGHDFSQGGVTPSKSHVEAVKSYPVSKTIPQVHTTMLSDTKVHFKHCVTGFAQNFLLLSNPL